MLYRCIEEFKNQYIVTVAQYLLIHRMICACSTLLMLNYNVKRMYLEDSNAIWRSFHYSHVDGEL